MHQSLVRFVPRIVTQFGVVRNEFCRICWVDRKAQFPPNEDLGDQIRKNIVVPVVEFLKLANINAVVESCYSGPFHQLLSTSSGPTSSPCYFSCLVRVTTATVLMWLSWWSGYWLNFFLFFSSAHAETFWLSSGGLDAESLFVTWPIEGGSQTDNLPCTHHCPD